MGYSLSVLLHTCLPEVCFCYLTPFFSFFFFSPCSLLVKRADIPINSQCREGGLNGPVMKTLFRSSRKEEGLYKVVFSWKEWKYKAKHISRLDMLNGILTIFFIFVYFRMPAAVMWCHIKNRLYKQNSGVILLIVVQWFLGWLRYQYCCIHLFFFCDSWPTDLENRESFSRCPEHLKCSFP